MLNKFVIARKVNKKLMQEEINKANAAADEAIAKYDYDRADQVVALSLCARLQHTVLAGNIVLDVYGVQCSGHNPLPASCHFRQQRCGPCSSG